MKVERFVRVTMGLSVVTIICVMVFSVHAAFHQKAAPPDRNDSGKLIVHEWGTFTSFSGSNGVQLDFRPLVISDLPQFVSDRTNRAGIAPLTKQVRAKIRMETPVTYFYTDRERTVRASVAFPQGLLTEFYPPVQSIQPAMDADAKDGKPVLENSQLDWGEIHLIPEADADRFVPLAKNSAHPFFEPTTGLLPDDRSSSRHYYHARETDSAIVHQRWKPPASEGERDYFEKFLFYRGVGKFEQPLTVTADDNGQIRITNTGKHAIRSLFRVTVAGSRTTVSQLDQVAAGQTVDFSIAEKEITTTGLETLVGDALVREKLYPREAKAMVKTWADSWFAEQGTRIFYMVPSETTDALLPLTITPAADETVRVLVGRVEIMLPSMEKKLMEVVRLQAKKRSAMTARQLLEKKNEPIVLPIPSQLVELGRLAEPSLVRIQQLAKDESVSNEASILIWQCFEYFNKTAEEQPAPAVSGDTGA